MTGLGRLHLSPGGGQILCESGHQRDGRGGIRYVQELFAVTHHSPPHSDVYGDYDRLGHLIDDRARPRNK